MKRSVLVGTVMVALAAFAAAARLAPAVGAQEITAKAVGAANRYLQSLDPEQKGKSAFEFSSLKKPTWHNGPPNSNPRPGATMGTLSPDQLKAAHELMQAVLSPYGYQKVLNIMAADEEFGRRGAAFPTGPKAYSLAVYGTPSSKDPWEVQINGHHLGLNVTIVGSENILAPSLTGAFPESFEKDGKTVHTLADETGAAFTLMEMLNEAQRAKAILPQLTGDLVLGPGQDGKVIEPEGLKGSEMTAPQKAALVKMTAPWINILDKRAAEAKLNEVRRTVNDTYLAWAGDTTRGGRAYFRVQGPTVFIEYGPMVNAGGGGARGRRGGAPGEAGQQPAPAPPTPAPQPAPVAPGQLAENRDPNHIHTVFRDFTNDYGKRLTK